MKDKRGEGKEVKTRQDKRTAEKRR